jgi:hypothetical protein
MNDATISNRENALAKFVYYKRHRSAKMIQRIFKRLLYSYRIEQYESRHIDAAITLQSFLRGVMSRRKSRETRTKNVDTKFTQRFPGVSLSKVSH